MIATQQRSLLLIGVALALPWLATGCTRYVDYSAFVHEPRPLVTSTEYRLSPPDTITIRSKRVREINGHSETIRPDGRLTLPLLGSVFVAGKTCEEVSAELEVLASDYYEDADITCRVIGFNSKKIFVFGEVSRPGAYPYDGANTVLETLAQAQPTRLAEPARIHVLRPNSEGELRKRMTIDMNEMVRKGDTTLNAVLEEGDIIYVPANVLASIGLGLQQLLLPIQPAADVVSGPGSIDQDLNAPPYRESSGGGTN
jgi:polysaccharide export outer membrane protein